MPIPSTVYLWKPSGIYYIGFTDERGKKRWVSIKTHDKSEALKKIINFQLVVQRKQVPRTLA